MSWLASLALLALGVVALRFTRRPKRSKLLSEQPPETSAERLKELRARMEEGPRR